MSEFTTMVKSAAEKMQAFNERLRMCCKGNPITDFEAVVVDGQPIIVLISEMVEASAEDVEEAKETGGTFSEGDLIPAEATICVQVAGMSAIGEAAARSEHVMSVLNKRGDGDCEEVRFFSGDFVQWIPDANDKTEKPKQILTNYHVVFAAVAYLQEPEDASATDEKKAVE